MNDDILKAKNEIYSFPAQFEFFKSNDIASACYKLTCGVEALFLEILSPRTVFSSEVNDIASMQNKARGGYRAAIKWAFRFCGSSEKSFLPRCSISDLSACSDIIFLGSEFSNIRNMFDRVELGRAEVNIDGMELSFKQSAVSRDNNAELYIRSIDLFRNDKVVGTDEYDHKG